MSDMKCPFCNSELDMDMCGECGCPNEQCQKSVFMFGSEELWQELIRTRKALDVAVDALNRIDETRSGIKENLHATNGRALNAGNGFCWATIDDIHNALNKITVLEQKG